GLLAPLAELAARHGVAVVAVKHLNKGGGDALARVQGSIAFVAAVRAAYLVVKDRDDSQRRLFLPAKNNLGPDDSGLAYKLSGVPALHLEWSPEPVRLSADEAVGETPAQRGPAPVERTEAEEWLRDTLAAGPVPSKEILAAARSDGIARHTLIRAKDSIGILAEKAGFDLGWQWRMPGDPRGPADGL
ncbi:MAG: hypothetical protein J7M19_10025, partial [Planctomycetes bacterium]|nr:hypothetical protein [Planctomycetota bacterium]